MKDRDNYRLDMFNQSTAPKRRKTLRPELVPRKKISKKDREKENRDRQLKFFLKAALASTFIMAAITIMIYSKVVLNEKVSTLHIAKNQLEQLVSENTRLNNEVEHKVSYSYITEYAEKNLGMVKMNSQQIHYINESFGDRVEMYIPTDEDQGIVEIIIGSLGKKDKNNESDGAELITSSSDSEDTSSQVNNDSSEESSESQLGNSSSDQSQEIKPID